MLKTNRTAAIITFLIVCLAISVQCKDKPKKKISDYTEADMEKLLDQWNVSIKFMYQRRRSNFSNASKSDLSIISSFIHFIPSKWQDVNEFLYRAKLAFLLYKISVFFV